MAVGSVSNKQTSAILRGIAGIAPALKAYWPVTTSIASGNLGLAVTTAAPTTAENGAGLLDGAYEWYVTQYDSLHDSEGNPQAAAAIRTVSLKKVLLTFADTPDSRTTHRRIYRNKAGNTDVHYFVAQVAVATGTYDDNTADSALTAAGGVLSTDNTVPPTGLRGILTHAARVFGFIGTNLYGSKASNIDQWPPLNVLPIARDPENPIRALGSAGDDLVIFKERGMHLMGYDLDPFDPADGWTQPILNAPGRGCLNEFCVVSDAGILFAMDRRGIHSYAGGRDVLGVTRAIQAVMDARNMALRDWFSAASDGKVARWFVALKGDGATAAAPKTRWAVCLDLTTLSAGDGPQWWLEYYDHPIIHSCSYVNGNSSVDTAADEPCVMVMDDTGTTMPLEWFTSDGLSEGLTGIGTVASVSTVSSNTRVEVGANDVMNNGAGLDVSRLYVWFLRNGVMLGPHRILTGTANTPDYFDLDGTPSPAPLIGDTFLIGGIQSEFNTPTISTPTVAPDARIHAEGLDLWYAPRPQAPLPLLVEEVKDAMGPANIGVTFNDGGLSATQPDFPGKVAIGGSPRDEGGRGMIRVPVGSEGFNSIRFVLRTYGPNVPVSISRMAMAQAVETP